MKTAKLILMVLLLSAVTGYGETIAHWNFEDGTPGTPFSAMDGGGSEDLANGYIMYGFDDFYGPSFSNDGNTPSGYGLSAYLNGDQDGYTQDAVINSWTPSQWTIETSFKLENLDWFQTLIGRDGQDDADDPESEFYLQYHNDTNAMRLNFEARDEERVIVDTNLTPELDKWYHIAAVCDGSEATVYINEFDGNGFRVIGSNSVADFNSTALDVPSGGVNWTFGRGWYDGGYVDQITGNMDNVRFSDEALSPNEFLIGIVKALNPYDGEDLVDLTTTLQWDFYQPNTSAYSYDVYFSSNLSDVDPELTTTEDIYDTTTTKSLEVTDLSRDTTYYWRVDPVMSDGNTPITGRVFSFKTIGETPVILEQPQGAVVEEGGTAVFTIDALNDGQGYEWYKEGDYTVLSTTDTLTISDVNLEDEGRYYCEVRGGNVTVSSNHVGLWTERLAGYWKLDGDFTDSVTEEVPGAPAHDGRFADTDITTGDNAPNFVDHNSIADQSMQVFFSEDGEHAEVDAPEFFNFFPQGFTANCWVKTSDTGWNVSVSKFDGAGWGVVAGNWAVFHPAADNVYGSANLDEWNMLTATYDPETEEVRLYVNGVLQWNENNEITTSTTVSNPNNVNVNEGPLRLGSDDGSSYGLDGFLDEVRVYTYPLSKTEVAALYNEHRTESLCLEPLELDLNNDCKVDTGDMAIIVENWLNCNIVPDCLE